MSWFLTQAWQSEKCFNAEEQLTVFMKTKHSAPGWVKNEISLWFEAKPVVRRTMFMKVFYSYVMRMLVSWKIKLICLGVAAKETAEILAIKENRSWKTWLLHLRYIFWFHFKNVKYYVLAHSRIFHMIKVLIVINATSNWQQRTMSDIKEKEGMRFYWYNNL